MFDYIKNNLSTIIVGAIVAAGIFSIAFKIYKDKRNGKSSCGSGCAGCPSGGICNTKLLKE